MEVRSTSTGSRPARSSPRRKAASNSGLNVVSRPARTVTMAIMFASSSAAIGISGGSSSAPGSSNVPFKSKSTHIFVESHGMTKMRAAVLEEFGKPLVVQEVDLADPKPGEVLVRLVACGVCHTDMYTASGADPSGYAPCVLGHEGAGVVE